MNIFKQRILLIFSAISGFFLLFSLFLIILNISNFGTPVILHFDGFKGIDFFGEKIDVWGIWLLSLIISILNIFLSEVLFFRERILSYLFIVVNFLISVLVLVVLGLIISIN